MRRYMLDTDSVSYALRGQGGVAARILTQHPSELCISAITLAELRYGAERKGSPVLHRLISRFVADVEVAAFDADAAERFGVIAAQLAARGTPIGVRDTLIAAHALTLGLVLVTNNLQHFQRVPSLQMENWA